jgi:hypothetical protein
MPLVLRSSTDLPLRTLQEVEQIVVIDKTGPGVALGVGTGRALIVGEFLKGTFIPTQVVSDADFTNQFGSVSDVLSQAANGTQNGSGLRYEGNGAIALKNKRFQELVIQRVDTEATDTDAGATKATIDITVAGTPTPTDIDLVIPAGTRFADAAIGVATKVVALSQDVTIPKGTALPVVLPVRVFFVKGISAVIAEIDTVIEPVIPGAPPTTTITVVNNATALFPGASVAALATLEEKIESQYLAAINKTLPGQEPQEGVTIIWSARRGATASVIRTPLVNNADDAARYGRGRVALVSGPRVGTAVGDSATAAAAKTAVDTVTTVESPGREDRKIVNFPYVKQFVDELGKNVTLAPDSFMASTLSNFAAELNPGARNVYIQQIQEFEDAFQASSLVRADYVNFKANGVAALRLDRSVGWQFQSGVTSVNPAIDPTRAPIKRRRMADEIQDSLVDIAAKYSKGPATAEAIDSFTGEVSGYLTGLLSPNNPARQRIDDFTIDAKGGNTPELVAIGIFTMIVKVRLLASMDTIVYQTQIGETVTP